jgi:aldose 1-epimerase
MTNVMRIVGAGVCAVCLTGCAGAAPAAETISGPKPFGKTPDGQSVDLFTLRNSKGVQASIVAYGGIVQTLKVPDKAGNLVDVVLGYDNLRGYIDKTPYFGAIIGRYGNRIGGAKFTLEGKTYALAANHGPNSLHGGLKGFDKVVWKAKPLSGAALELTYLSKDGEEGFPGNLRVTVVYTLTEKNELRMDTTATTDKTTLCNITHHSYFNLNGQGNGIILDHELFIDADKTTPVDKELITTGEYADVTGTPFDFRKPTTIGARIDDPDTELQYGPGYDHNWVIDKPLGKMGLMARATGPKTGIVMEVFSDEPGLQFYAGNFLDGTITGKGGKVYQKRSGFCMEPHHYPDSPNKPQFPTTELKPGQTYHNTIIYQFSVK